MRAGAEGVSAGVEGMKTGAEGIGSFPECRGDDLETLGRVPAAMGSDFEGHRGNSRNFNGPSGIRTQDLRIMSPLL